MLHKVFQQGNTVFYNPSNPPVNPNVVLGCTDSLALNYNPLANVDDSTCCGANFSSTFGLQLGQNINGLGIGDQLGWSVSLNIDGTIMAVGSPDETTSIGLNSGSVRVYEYINEEWFQIGEDIYGEMPSDHSGWSLSLNDAGNIIAIGAQYNDANGVESGHEEFMNMMVIHGIKKAKI